MKSTLLIFATLYAAIHGHLICYYCEDCNSSDPTVQPCGLSDPILTTPTPQSTSVPISGRAANTVNPWVWQANPILTQPIVAPNSGGVLTTIWPGAVTTQWWDTGAIGGGTVLTTIWPGSNVVGSNVGNTPLTTIWPGSNVGSNVGNTPLTTIWPGSNVGSNVGNTALTTIWPWWPAKRNARAATVDDYACVMIKYNVDDRQIVRKGCVRQGQNKDEPCSEGSNQQCTLCSSPLCNNGN